MKGLDIGTAGELGGASEIAVLAGEPAGVVQGGVVRAATRQRCGQADQGQQPEKSNSPQR